MYKSFLQVMCQQRRWALPEYTSTREGPDHDPRFRATVVVGGASFDAPELSKSSKEAQNKAAEVAFNHFSANPRPSPAPSPLLSPPPASFGEKQESYKSQLQNYVQRRNIDQPIYTSVREGPFHAIRFKAAVSVDGKIFRSPNFFNTLKEAEHDAARVALMSLPLEESQQEEPGFYKNLLQELAQKEGFSLPTYRTVRDGSCHMPTFSSFVEIEGESFEGDFAKTKKQAEMNAAKVAYNKFKERKLSRLSSGHNSLSQMEIGHKPISLSKWPDVVKNTWKEGSFSAPGSSAEIEQEEDHSADKRESGTLDSTKLLANDHKSNMPSELRGASSSYNGQPPTAWHEPHSVITMMKEGITAQHPLVKDGSPSPSTLSDGSDRSVASPSSELSRGGGGCSLLCNRVQVYPQKPDLVLPEGASLLPFSDGRWVAVSLDFPNREDTVAVRLEL